MATGYVDCINNIRKGKFNWNIKVRIIRLWRNWIKEGKPVKGFNILVVDEKNVTIQAFINGKLAPKFENVITLGDVFLISNFSVQDVTNEDKNLLTNNKKTILFTGATKATEVDDDDSLIPTNVFDLYEISDLLEVEKQDRYLADFIGVLEDYQPIKRYRKKSDQELEKAFINFSVTDGRTSIRCTFWDSMAERFQKGVDESDVEPNIVIVVAAKIVKKNDGLEVKLQGPTTFYLNYNHYSVYKLQKSLGNIDFTQHRISTQNTIDRHAYTVEELKTLGTDYIGRKIIMLLQIKKLQNPRRWFFEECTSCQEEITTVDNEPICIVCNRVVRYAYKKFEVSALCGDSTGTIGCVIPDREIRHLTNSIAEDVKHDSNLNVFPTVLQNLTNIDITALLKLTKENITERCNIFTVVELIRGHIIANNDGASSSRAASISNRPTQATQDTLSTADYHLEAISIQE